MEWVAPIEVEEVKEIFKQDPREKSLGGFQSFMCDLRNRITVDFETEIFYIRLNDEVIGKAKRYAYDYQNGGWQGRIERSLGRFLEMERT